MSDREHTDRTALAGLYDAHTVGNPETALRRISLMRRIAEVSMILRRALAQFWHITDPVPMGPTQAVSERMAITREALDVAKDLAHQRPEIAQQILAQAAWLLDVSLRSEMDLDPEPVGRRF